MFLSIFDIFTFVKSLPEEKFILLIVTMQILLIIAEIIGLFYIKKITN